MSRRVGADTAAHHWAGFKRVPVQVFHADWGQFGSGAGPSRNSKMLAEGKPEIVLAFPGGRGTANMVKQARSAGVSVCEVGRTADWSLRQTHHPFTPSTDQGAGTG